MYIKNKLLVTPDQIKPSFKNWEVKGVFNPAAVRLPNKKIMLLARVAEAVKQTKKGETFWPVIVSKKDHRVKYGKIAQRKVLDKGRNVIYLKDGMCRLTTISHLRRIILSEDGFNIEKIEDIPAFVGEPGDSDLGVEDPRIIKIGNTYMMTYVSVSLEEGVCVSLATSKNLKDWDRKGIIFTQENKDVVLFPEKIKGQYVALHRPEGKIEFSKMTIWISHSPDLIHWGEEKSILSARPNSWGDAWVGSGAPPIKTDKGWLLFYHGARVTKSGKIYGIGAALLDLKNPEKVLARSSMQKPLIAPTEPYEKKGFIGGVVFPTAAILTLDKKEVLIYSGGADTVLTVKKVKLKEVLDSLDHKNI